MDLFESKLEPLEMGQATSKAMPIAARMRPQSLEEVVGQDHILYPGSPIEQVIANSASAPTSLILWGPPGTGKTTLAQLAAKHSQRKFVELSAVNATVADVRRVIDGAKFSLAQGETTLLFVDEFHRFSKTQQDVLLPAVENGWVVIMAATTENPSFSVVSPLLSRSLLLTINRLSPDNLQSLIERALQDERGFAGNVSITKEAKKHILRLAGADARKMLTIIEACAQNALSISLSKPELTTRIVSDTENTLEGKDLSSTTENNPGSISNSDNSFGDSTVESEIPGHQTKACITSDIVQKASDSVFVQYDRVGDNHYDVTSAFIKSMRGSDVNAALHYLARMIVGGEDPRFIARRIMICAAEDVGMADPSILTIAVSAATAVEKVGLPEGRIILAEAVVAVASAPKSNRVYLAIEKAISDVKNSGSVTVPAHLRDSHYAGAEKIGNGIGYRYAHDYPYGVVAQTYLPAELEGTVYYEPTTHGYESELTKRLEKIQELIDR